MDLMGRSLFIDTVCRGFIRIDHTLFSLEAKPKEACLNACITEANLHGMGRFSAFTFKLSRRHWSQCLVMLKYMFLLTGVPC
jgi:hypothetical protein